MRKKFIIGMTALGLGAALAGGVGGYFIGEAIKQPAKDSSAIVEEIKEYDLPEDLANVSYTEYEIGDNYALLSSSAVGAYLLDKINNKTTFVISSYVSDYSQEVGGKVYFWMNNGTAFSIDTTTGEKININFETDAEIETVKFLNSNETNNLFLIETIRKNNSSLSYYLVVYGIESGANQKFLITNTILNLDTCVEFGDYYFLTSDNVRTTVNPIIINKSTQNVSTLSYYTLYNPLDSRGYYFDEGTNKLYGLFKTSNSSSYYVGVVKLDEATGSKLGSTSITDSILESSNTHLNIKKFTDGLLFNIVCSSYQTNVTYVSSEDIATELKYNNVSQFYTYDVLGHVVYSTQASSSNYYAQLLEFNDETKQLEAIYTEPEGSTQQHRCTIYSFNEKFYVQSGYNPAYRYAQITVTEDNKLEFTAISLVKPITSISYAVGDNQYIFSGNEDIFYYDFESDIYKQLVDSASVVELSNDGKIVTIYVDDGIKYEFNTETLSCKAVAIWESEE